MNLRDARQLISDTHVKEAARLIDEKGLDWLFNRTGRELPRFRYIVIDGRRYPTKAFGFLTAQLAGNTESATNDMTVNEAVAPLKRLGYVEVNGLGGDNTPAQDEAQKRSYYLTLARPSQSAFRQLLLTAYGGRCAITGNAVSETLEAAHVEPFSMGGGDILKNGILLRADLHRLFDSGHIAINPDSLLVSVVARIKNEYRDIDGVQLTLPDGGPSSGDFGIRWQEFARSHRMQRKFAER